MLTYNPPNGWKYGFPKAFNPREGESFFTTLQRDGYPLSEITSLCGDMHVRFKGSREELDDAERHLLALGKSG